jgi:hypothetical protein
MTSKELRPVATLIDAQGFDVAPLPWEDVEARIDAARWYWLSTVHPSGRPHTRPVLAVWTEGVLCTTSSRAAQKGINLRRDPRCSVAIMDDDMHIVLEGMALPVEGGPDLERVAESYRAKYDWPVTVVEGGFEAPYGAPGAGPAPYEPYQIAPSVVYGFGTAEPIVHRHTRWRFSEAGA